MLNDRRCEVVRPWMPGVSANDQSCWLHSREFGMAIRRRGRAASRGERLTPGSCLLRRPRPRASLVESPANAGFAAGRATSPRRRPS